MKRNLILTSLTILFSTIFGKWGNIMAEAAEPITDAQTVSNQENGLDIPDTDLAVQDFSYQFFAQNLDSENPILSPVSAYLALSMVGLGAEGATQEEFVAVLGNDMAAAAEEMMDLLPKNSENTKVSLANSAWLANQFTVNDSWLNGITSLMDAEAIQADLSSPAIVGSMNNWIEKQTNGLIEDMVTEPFSKDTMLVLFNTVYFKAKWKSPFAVHATFEDKFTLKNGKTISVPMMHKNNATGMDYISNDTIEGLVFPYRNWGDGDGNFAMIALKPSSNKTNKNTDIRELYSELTTEVISDLLRNAQTKTVNTMLPKFEITFDKELNQSLQNMGLKEAFDADKANLSLLGASENGNLYIDLVRQKAKIIVDEDGTEAAAATEVATRYAAARIPQKPINVFFNEPFIYIIMDMDKQIPLFIGILDNPAA